MTSIRIEDAELYRELNIPFESEKSGEDAVIKFVRMVREARAACRIPDIVITGMYKAKSGDRESDTVFCFNCGSDLVADSLAEYTSENARILREKRMRNIANAFAKSHQEDTKSSRTYGMKDGVIAGGPEHGPPFVTPDGITRDCICSRCLHESVVNGYSLAIWWIILCPKCGNKRCPHAEDHRNDCTGSNEPGQIGSAFRSDVASAASPGFCA